MAFLSSFYPQPVVPNAIEVTASGSDTARTLSDRFGDTVKVADFGAKGDWNGTTGTDDRAAIQAAIDYAISLGRATIEFEAGKTYLLDSGVGADISSLKISGGTNETDLTFRGNGARLWIQRNNVVELNNFFRVVSRGKRFVWEDITFERSSVRLPSNYTSQENNGAVYMSPISIDRIELVAFYRVNFINTFTLSAKNFSQTTVSWRDTFNKLALVEITDCKFIYPYGSNSLVPLGGGQIINLSTWVETAKYTGCYIDGAVGGKIPNDVTFPKDGFNYINATNNIFNSCHFQNLWVEAIIAQSEGTPHIALISDFVQVAEDSNVTVTLDNGNLGTSDLIAGDRIVVIPDLADRYFNTDASVGIYEVVTPPANWNSETTMVLKRLNDSVLPFSSSLWSRGSRDATAKITTRIVKFNPSNNTHNVAGTYYYDGEVDGRPSFIRGDLNNGWVPVSGNKIQFSTANNRWEAVTGGSTVRYYNISTASLPPNSGWTDGSSATATSIYNAGRIFCYLHEQVKNTRFVISNCDFSGSSLITKENGSGGPWAMSPCVFITCPTIVNGCRFSGYKTAISAGPQYVPNLGGPVIITNNYFYGSKPVASGQNTGPQVYLLSDNSIFSNNIMVQDNSEDFVYGLYVGGDNTLVVNNSFVIHNPSSVTLPFPTAAINTYQSQSPWTMRIDNNIVIGWDYAFYAFNSTARCGSFYGNPRLGMYHPSSSLVVPRDEKQSPDGSTWTMGITNDGELEVIK